MFKECKVVMLPTNEKAPIIEKAYKFAESHENPLIYSHKDHILYLHSIEEINYSGYEYNHLYITSDDKIQEGDYIIDCNGVFGPYETGDILFGKFNPIIASTDPSLNLPSPSKEFIKAYCEKGGIDTVMVKYDIEDACCYNNMCNMNNYGQCKNSHIESLKVIDNTIITETTKESWTKEEVLNILESFATEVDNQYSPNPEWYTTAQQVLNDFKL